MNQETDVTILGMKEELVELFDAYDNFWSHQVRGKKRGIRKAGLRLRKAINRLCKDRVRIKREIKAIEDQICKR